MPYYEAYKEGWRFIGLSFRFVAIDFAGAVLSLASLATQHTWDKFGGATYIIVMILEIGFVIIQLSWIWRKRETIRAARAEGKTYDEYVMAKTRKQRVTGGNSEAEFTSTLSRNDCDKLTVDRESLANDCSASSISSVVRGEEMLQPKE